MHPGPAGRWDPASRHGGALSHRLARTGPGARIGERVSASFCVTLHDAALFAPHSILSCSMAALVGLLAR